MKNKIKLLGLVMALAINLIPAKALAVGSFGVYISPAASSIVNGNNVNVTVRINPNSTSVDSVQAILNYDSTKLQYVGYSAGAFAAFNSSNSGSSFSYVGTIFGSSISSDSLIFSVNFKAIATGTASLSVSGASAAIGGESISYTGSNTGSVTISSPATTPPASTTPPAATYTAPVNTTPATTTDKAAPKLVSDPTLSAEKNNIIVKFKTDEEAKTATVYYATDDKKLTINNDSYDINHEVNIGAQNLLTPGTVYIIEITAIDKLGNSSVVISQTLRTKGVDFRIKITDLDGNPLVNHPVQIFSEPKNATTDKDGFVVFSDMSVGNHTLVFEVDGLTLRQPVEVTDIKADSDNTETDATQVKLPVRFASVVKNIDSKNVDNNSVMLIVAIVSAFFGAILMAVLNLRIVKNFFSRLVDKLLRTSVKK